MIYVGFFLAMLATLPVMAAMRFVLSRRINQMMGKTSPSKDAGGYDGPGEEIPAGSTPRIAFIEADSDDAKSDDARRTEARDGRRRFINAWAIEVAALALTFTLVSLIILPDSSVTFGELFSYRPGQSFMVSSSYVAYYRFEMGIGLVMMIYLTIITLRLAFYLRFYAGGGIRAARKTGFWRRWLIMPFEELFRILFNPKNSWFVFLMYAVFLIDFDRREDLPVVSIVSVFGLAIHVGGLLWLARSVQSTRNRRLLILRVFGQNKSSVLTFGALRDFWNYKGSSFTVVDKSYLAYRFRGHSEQHVSTIFFTLLSFYMFFVMTGRPIPTGDMANALGIFAALFFIIGYAIYLIVLYVRAPRYFASDRAHIRKMISNTLRRPIYRWSLTFRNLDMHCYDDTWRDAVAEFVDVSDVVLMDLRGYSEERSGCEYEVDFLFDSLPVEQIVFLVDSETDVAIVETLVCERWTDLNVRSPNLGRIDPVVTIYCNTDGRRNDMKGLVNLLAARVCQSSTAKASLTEAA